MVMVMMMMMMTMTTMTVTTSINIITNTLFHYVCQHHWISLVVDIISVINGLGQVDHPKTSTINQLG